MGKNTGRYYLPFLGRETEAEDPCTALKLRYSAGSLLKETGFLARGTRELVPAVVVRVGPTEHRGVPAEGKEDRGVKARGPSWKDPTFPPH